MDRLEVNWRWIMARGILGVLFGFLVLAFPVGGLFAVAMIFAAYVTVDGIMSLSSAWSRHKHDTGRWGLLAVDGALGVVAGLISFLYPGLALLMLVVLMGFWAIATGFVELYAAFAYRKVLSNSVLLGLAGVVSLLFGIFVLARPVAGAAALLAMVGAYSMFFGVLLTTWSFRLRHQAREGLPGEAMPSGLRPT